MKKLILITIFLCWVLSFVDIFASDYCKYETYEDIKYVWVEYKGYYSTTEENNDIVAYMAKKDWKRFVVKDWVKSKSYEDIIYFTYSEEKDEYAFIAVKWDKNILVRNWVESEEYDIVYDLNYFHWWNTFVYVALNNWKYYVVENWKKSIGYDNLSHNSKDIFIKYSQDKNSYSYIAKKDLKWFVVKDGVVWKYYDYTYFITYNPEGNWFSYVAEENDEEFIVKDWIEWKKYDKPDYERVFEFMWYSLSWDSLEYVIKRDWKVYLIKNWKEFWGYDKIWKTIYLNDGNDSVFFAKEWEKMFFIKNWEKVWEYDDIIIGIGYITWYQWKNFLIVKRDWRYFLISEFTEIWSYDYVDRSDFSCSLDESSCSFIAERDWKQFIVKDWVELKKIDKINKFEYIEWTSDVFYYWIDVGQKNISMINNVELGNNVTQVLSWRDWTYIYVLIDTEWKKSIINDWIESLKYDYLDNLMYFKDSEKLIYLVYDEGKSFMVNNWTEGKKYDDIVDRGEVKQKILFTYSANWEKIAYVAKEKDEDGRASKEFVVNNNVEWKKYYLILDIKYSLDGKDLFYVVKEENSYTYSWEKIYGKSFFVHNWIESKKYDDLYNIEEFLNWDVILSGKNNGEYFKIRYSCSINNILETSENFANTIISLKTKLESDEKWWPLVNKLEELISKMTDEKLLKFYKLLDSVNFNSSSFVKYKDFLEYLKAKIWIEIYKRELNK